MNLSSGYYCLDIDMVFRRSSEAVEIWKSGNLENWKADARMHSIPGFRQLSLSLVSLSFLRGEGCYGDKIPGDTSTTTFHLSTFLLASVDAIG